MKPAPIRPIQIRPLPIVPLLAGWAAALAGATIIHERAWRGMSHTFLEMGCYLVLGVALCAVRPVRAYFTSLPRPHQWIVMGFVCLLLIGQGVNQTRLTFPFTSWAMYGKPETHDTLIFYRWQGMDQYETAMPLNAYKLLAPVGRAEVASQFKHLGTAAFSGEHTVKQEAARSKLTALLRAMGTIYNAQHPERPLRSVELIRCALPLQEGYTPEIVREPIWRVALGKDGTS